MKVRVIYTTQLKAALDRPDEEIELPEPALVTDVLAALSDKHGARFDDLVWTRDRELLPSLLVCVADAQVADLTVAEVHDGDEVTLVSAISGG